MASWPPVLERLPVSRVCVSVTGDSVEKMQANAAALLPEFPFQEFRLDYLPDLSAIGDSLRTLSRFVQSHGDAIFLATCRPQRSGGLAQISAETELAILSEAAGAGFKLVDLSLESAEALGAGSIQQLRSAGATVLVSFHDFEGTGDPEAVLARMRVLQPDLCKIVPTAHTLSHSLAVLHFLQTHRSDRPMVVALAMGEAGVPSRILGPRAGSAFTFAAAIEAEATAPGQLTARTLADRYRAGSLTPATRLFGVAGDPIHASLSPLMLNTAFVQAGLDAVYLPLKTADPEELFRAARDLPLDGFSVTMPLKQAVFPLLDAVDPLAARIGAVNTVQRRSDGSFHGFNTDAAGIVSPLEQRLSLRNARVLVLGAGGAARAAVFGCAERGAHVFVANRTPQTAQRLAAESGATALPRAALAVTDFDVLIQTTPAGMRGNSFTLPLGEHELRARVVFDLVYNPLETPLLALARAKGLEVIPGMEMFVHQGATQFEIWTGQSAPAEAMSVAVLNALRTTAVTG